jgi:hypothetical protein
MSIQRLFVNRDPVKSLRFVTFTFVQIIVWTLLDNHHRREYDVEQVQTIL